MKSLINHSLLFLILSVLVSCTISPVAIDYDEDQCHACKMTISDARFGSELITKKGKVYKFDAIECMVPELNKNGDDYYQFVLVTDFNQPKQLVDARTCSFLISEKLTSPMGGNLSAYRSQEAGDIAYEKNGGQLYPWKELQQHPKFEAK